MKINLIIHGLYVDKFQTKLLILTLQTLLNVFIVLMLNRTPNVPEQILLMEGGHGGYATGQKFSLNHLSLNSSSSLKMLFCLILLVT
jgi:hypothetical protein